jgi:OOP family OmpA-OmpF porin
MKIRSLLLAATVIALPVAAMAGEPVEGVYVGLGAGFDYLNTVNGNSITVAGQSAPIPSANLTSNGGWAVLGSVGYGFGDLLGTGGGIRVELEGNYRQNNTHVGSSGVAAGGGNFQQYGGLVNVLYDFNDLVPWVTPYVGAGVGYIENNFQNGHVYALNGSSAISYNDSSKGSAAAQLILGGAWSTGIPGLAITTEFRFLGEFANQKYGGTGYISTPAVVASGPASTKFNAPTNETFLIGLRYAFNAAPAPIPAPAPVAAPAPAAARTYLVFFDWDRADLTARAKQIIAEAAQASTHVQLTQIEVSGYADRTGTAQYNLGLSRRRADNVAAELVRLGVPKNVIAIQAFGDTHLLVPTAQGVREPQNRRVEIVLK